jgi:hypothetical protein
MPAKDNQLTAHLVEQYDQQGILRLQLPSSVKTFNAGFLSETACWLEQMGAGRFKPGELPQALPVIAKQDRALVGRLYKIARRFPSVKRLACDPWLTDVAAQLMGTPLASCCHFVNIRIDLPGEEKYLLPAHQDFPYIQGSFNGVTWWIPFIDTSLEVGPPSWIPGSHKLGVLNVKEFDYASTNASGGRSFRIVDEAQFKDTDYVHEPVLLGEGLVFNTLLVHKSEPNQSQLARINIQVRFDDTLAHESLIRNYPEGLYLGDTFAKTYPEYLSHD